jgi:hypothetical protein
MMEDVQREAALEVAKAVGALNVRARSSACATRASVFRLPGRLQREPMGLSWCLAHFLLLVMSD